MEKPQCPKTHFKNDTRLPDTFQAKATSSVAHSEKSKCLQLPHTQLNENVRNNTATQRPRRPGKSSRKPKLSVNSISGPKERRFHETHIQFKSAQLVCHNRQIPLAEHAKYPNISAAERLAGQNRPISSILPSSDTGKTPVLSSASLRRGAITNDVSTIWLEFGTKSLRHPDQLDCTNLTRQRLTPSCLPRRLFDSSPKQADLKISRQHNFTVARKTRLEDQLPEIHNNPTKAPRISWDIMGHMEGPKIFTRTEGNKVCKHGEFCVTSETKQFKRLRGSGWHAKFRQLRGPQRPSKFPVPSKDVKLGPCEQSTMQLLPSRGGYSGTKLVVEQLSQIDSNTNTSPNTFPDNRCLRYSMGSKTQQPQFIGSMVGFREVAAWEPKRASHSIKKFTARQQPESTSVINTPSERQPYCCILRAKRRRYSFDDSYGFNTRNLPMDRQIPNTPQGIPSARNIQLRGRPPFEIQENPSVAPIATSNKENLHQMGETTNRSLCVARSTCGSNLCITRSNGSKRRISRCSQPSLDVSTSMGISPTLPSSQGITTPEHGKRSLPPCSTTLGARFLAIRSEEEGSVSPTYDLEPPTSPYRPEHRTSASESTRNDPGGLEMWGWSRNLTDWSEEQKSLLRSGWRESTQKTYKSSWLRWCRWSNKHGVNVNSPTGSDLARYLSDLHQKDGLAFKTILLHKSVVSTMCNTEISGTLSNHSLVKQVLKAISLKRPSLTKPPIWDVTQLITFLSTKQVNKDSLFEVSRHTAALLLICSGRRVHDLTLLNIDSEHMYSSEDSLVLWPMFGSKTDTTDYRQSGWKLLHNHSCEALNPIYWINLLIDLSQQKRGAINNLFITLRGIPKAASRTIIGSWVKSLLIEAGITATPGSVRAAVASRNWVDNFSIDTILAQGNWRSGDTFRQFYRREIRPNNSSTSLSNLFRCA